MRRKGLVSVVVPIYNVRKYIHRCIDSILNQTYQHIEVILVNDGTPDDCGIIADEYQEADQRVHVIHQENGGLSDARNCGIKHVTGEYTMFVDSDDWLDVNTIEYMVNHSVKYQADVVQSAFYYAYDDKLLVDNRYYTLSSPPEQLYNKTIMYELVINEKVKNFAWGKLYKTDIIYDIPFLKDVLFEDVFWAYQVMHKVKSFVLMHQPLYYYYQRDDSIVANYTPRNLDILNGLKMRHSFIETYYEELVWESYRQILKASIIHYNLLLFYKRKGESRKYRKDIKKYIQCHWAEMKKTVKYDKHLRRQLYLFSLSPHLNVVFLGLRKGLMKASLIPRPDGLTHVKKNPAIEENG